MSKQDAPPLQAGKVSRGSALPLYHQIASALRDYILSRSRNPGERIPSEGEISRMYGTSRVTVRQALRILVDEGLVSREPGRGTFIRDRSIAASTRRLTSFTGEMRLRNMHPSAVVLDQRVLSAGNEIADALDLTPPAPVLRLRRLRCGDGEPMGIQTSYVDNRRFPNLDAADFTIASLYSELHQRYGIVIDEADEAYSATAVDDNAAKLLKIPPGAPALRVTRRGFNRGDAVEYTTSLMRADRYHIEMRITRCPEGAAEA
jgi:GntR family transcriptional regulator